MCECVNAALEQVAGNRLVYVLGGFGCAVVAIGFTVGELLRMKKKNQNIGILDWLGFLAALSQVSSSGLHVVFVCLHKSSPINFSAFSLIFALVSSYYKIIWKSRNHEFVIYCKQNIHCQSLKVCEEIHPTKTLFECPHCANFNGGDGEFNAFSISYTEFNAFSMGEKESSFTRRKAMETKSSFTNRKALIIIMTFDSLHSASSPAASWVFDQSLSSSDSNLIRAILFPGDGIGPEIVDSVKQVPLSIIPTSAHAVKQASAESNQIGQSHPVNFQILGQNFEFQVYWVWA
ncbi:hypothetical protein RHGRI_000339 [Rhododendron griersonianum]|uniref:Isopropylmalate dehydrogenase-like domain-containing protein n=1 Tax=Rhododendron griersonianum TaxID=479676 RepID=A0AAV6LHC1_9ERIC|nr:hypothetical protein RHGRI_000339 [Rhododendron griersonianum]